MDGADVFGTLRRRQGEHWLADGSLDTVAEINQQCLDYLASLADTSDCAHGLFADCLAPWRSMSVASRARLAAIPCLLADAGFDDETRWRDLSCSTMRDAPRQFANAAFVGGGAEEFIRRVLMFGWHLARANRQLARVALGMSSTCAKLIGDLRLRDLDWIVRHCPDWVRPRWEEKPRIWRYLLLAAQEPFGELPNDVGLRGLQLMAARMVTTPTRYDSDRETRQSRSPKLALAATALALRSGCGGGQANLIG